MNYWKKAKVLEALKITDKHLKNMKEMGAPSPIPVKGYDIKSLCEWIVARPMKRTDRTKIREYAQKVLNKLIGKQEVKVQTEEKVKKEKQKVQKDLQPGLIAALERAREAEVSAYKAHQDFMKKSGILSAACLDTWQKTLDILRKCETDFTKVLQRRRELVEMKEVQQFLEVMIEQTKSILLNLPAKLAPLLECLPWPEIEKKLDQEIRDAISKLTNIS